jgi:CBS domain-containing protein
MKVAECMTRDVTLASPDWTLKEAGVAMAQCDAGALPVSEDDRLVGMITDRDIAIRAVACGKGPDATVREAMTSEVRYCFEDDSADDVLRNMSELQVRRLPVLSRDKRLVGIVSLSDLTRGGETRGGGAALGQIARPGGEHRQSLH